MTDSQPRGTLSEEQLAGLRAPKLPAQAQAPERVQNPFLTWLVILAGGLVLLGVFVAVSGAEIAGAAMGATGVLAGLLALTAGAVTWQLELSERRRRTTP